jgi:hypothetical protein
MKKRILVLLAVVALMAVMLVASAGYAFAYAYTDQSQGNVTAEAEDNCVANFEKQAKNEVAPGGGPKAGGEAGEEDSAPTNCDHFFQEEGAIGKDK